MSQFKKQIVKTLLTGQQFIDNHQVDNDSTLREYQAPGPQYDFDWLTSNNADFHNQYQSADLPEVLPGKYFAEIGFDETTLNGMTGPASVQMTVGPRTAKAVVNGTAAPFSTALQLLKPNEYEATATATGMEQLLDSAIAHFRKTFPDYIIERSGSSMIVTARFEGTFYNATWTFTGPTGAIELVLESANDNQRWDQQYYATTGDYSVVLDVEKQSDSFEPTSVRLNLVSLTQSFNDLNSYRFNLKGLFNKMHRKQPMINQVYVDPVSLGSYEGIIPAYVEPFNQYLISTFSQTGISKQDEDLSMTVRVFDAKWDTLSDERLFDYIPKNRMIAPTPGADTLYQIRLRYTFDFRTAIPDTEIIYAQLNRPDASQIIFQGSPSFTSSGFEVQLTTNIADLLDEMRNSYYDYLKDGPFDGYNSTTSTPVQVNSQYGYIDFVFVMPVELKTEISSFDINANPWVKITYSTGPGIQNPQSWSLNPSVEFGPDGQFITWQPVKLLSSYREVPTQFWQLQNGAAASVSTTAKVVDVYYTDRWMSSAWVSMFCLHPGWTVAGTPDHLLTGLSMSQMRITHQSGLVSWDNRGAEGDDNPRSIFAAIVENICFDSEVSGQLTPGIIQFNWAAHVGWGWLSPYFASGDLPEEIEFTLDYLVSIGLEQFRIPATQSIRLRMHQLLPGEAVHEFAFKGRLGGMSSLTVVDQRRESIKTDTTLRSATQEFDSETYFNTEDGFLIQNSDLSQYSYKPYFELDSVEGTGTYEVEYRTTDLDEAVQLRDLAESDAVYYRQQLPSDPIGRQPFVWIPVMPQVEWKITEAREYSVMIRWQLMSDSNNVLRINNKIQ